MEDSGANGIKVEDSRNPEFDLPREDASEKPHSAIRLNVENSKTQLDDSIITETRNLTLLEPHHPNQSKSTVNRDSDQIEIHPNYTLYQPPNQINQNQPPPSEICSEIVDTDHDPDHFDPEPDSRADQEPSEDQCSDDPMLSVGGQRKMRQKSLSQYKRPENQPPACVPASTDDDLLFDRLSASQVYENFIKAAYGKAQKQAEQSRAMIEAHMVQEIGQLSRETEFYESRPIRTYGRHNDTTHENGNAETRSNFRHLLHSTDSPPLSFDITGDSASSSGSSSANDGDDPSGTTGSMGADDRTTSTTAFYAGCETNSLYGNRRYYSKFGRDPDYFDFDLGHSVNLFRRQNPSTAPVAPTLYEHKLFMDKSRLQGQCTISPHLFGNNDLGGGMKKTGALQTSFISSALRTPSYWEYRYQHMNGPLSKS